MKIQDVLQALRNADAAGDTEAATRLAQLAVQLQPDLAPTVAAPAAPSKERTWTEAATDIGAGAVSGLGSLVQLPGQLYGLATGDFEKTGLLGLGDRIAKAGDEMKSSGLKAREAGRAQAITEAEKDGQLSAFGAAFGQTVKDPALLTSFLAEQIPQLVIPGGAAVGAGRLALGKAAAVGLGEAAAKEAGIAAGTKAAVRAGAVQQGADVGAQAYDDIYKKLTDQGVAAPEAAARTINLARAAGVGGAVLSLLAQRLPGAHALESALAGKVGVAGAASGAFKGALGEGLSEAVEEGGGKVVQNAAMQRIDPTQSLMQGVGATAGQAAVGGVGMGGGAGAISGLRGTDVAVDRLAEEQAAGAAERRARQAAQREAAALQKTGVAGEQMLDAEASEQAKAAKAEAAAAEQAMKEDYAQRRAEREAELKEAFPADYSDMMERTDRYGVLATELASLDGVRQTAEVRTRRAELTKRMQEVAAEDDRVPNELRRMHNDQLAAAKKAGFPAEKAAKVFAATAPAQMEIREALPAGTLPPQTDLFGNPLLPAVAQSEGLADVAEAELPLTSEVLRDAGLAPTKQELEAAGQRTLSLRRTGAGQPTSPVREAPAPRAANPTATEVVSELPAVTPPPAAPAQPGAITAAEVRQFGTMSKANRAWLTANIEGRTPEQVRDMVDADPTILASVPKGLQVVLKEIIATAAPKETANAQPPSTPAAPAAEPRLRARRGQPSVAVSGEPAGANPVGAPAAGAANAQESTPPVGLGLAPAAQPAGEGTGPQGAVQPALDEEAQRRAEAEAVMAALEKVRKDAQAPKPAAPAAPAPAPKPAKAAPKAEAEAPAPTGSPFDILKKFPKAVETVAAGEEEAAEKPAPAPAPAPAKAEEQQAADEEAAEDALRAKAEADVDAGPIGQAIEKAESGDLETKAQVRAFVTKLERNGTLDDVEDVREALSDREQDVGDVLGLVTDLLDTAREDAIDERVDELRADADLEAETPAKAETAEDTKTHPDWATGFEPDVNGTIVYSDDEVALLRGYSAFTGQYVYMGVSKAGKSRTRNDIASFKGPGFSAEQTARLLKAKQEAVDREIANAKKHPEGPFAKATSNVVSSGGVAPQYAKYLADLMKSIGLGDIQVFLLHPEDLKAQGADAKYGLYGDYASAKSAGMDAGEDGSVRQYGPDRKAFYISLRPGISEGRTLETLAHELGHIIEKVALSKASPETRAAIKAEYEAWVAANKGKSAKEIIASLRNRETAEAHTAGVSDSKEGSTLSPYWTSFSEWFADNTSKWATTSAKPVGIVEKFFADVAKTMRSLVAAVTGRKFPPAKSVADFLDAMGPDAAAGWLTSNASTSFTAQLSSASTSTTQQVTDILRDMDRALPVEDTRPLLTRAADALRDGMPKKTEGVGLIQRVADMAADQLDASEPLMRAIRREVRLALPPTEANEVLVGLALSQASHDGGMAAAALDDGGIAYDEDLAKFTTEKSEFSRKAVHDVYKRMAKDHGMTLPQARFAASTALESKRMLSLYDAQATMLANAEVLKKSGATAAAAKMREKAEGYIFHMTQEQAQKGMELFDAMPEIHEIEQIKEGMRGWIRDHLQATGVWSEEIGQWMLDNAEWVPFNREAVEDAESNQEGGFNAYVRGLQAKAKDHAFKGSMREVHDVMDNFENWADYSVRRGILNAAATKIATAALDYLPESEAVAVKSPMRNAANRTVSYLVNGEPRYVEFDSAAKAQIFKGAPAMAKSALPVIGGLVDSLNSVFRGAILNFPLFPIYQLAMDSISAVYLSGLSPKYAYKIPVLAVKEALATMTKTSAAHEKLRSVGAVGVHDYNATLADANADVISRMKSMSGVSKYVALMHNMNLVADNAVRQGVYLAARDSGLSEAAAIEKAFEIINFRTRVGNNKLAAAARNVVFLNSFYAASRAALKVLSNEGISPTERAQARKNLLSNMAWLGGLSFMMALANIGDDDYEKMSRQEQAGKLTLPGMGGWGIPLRPDVFMLVKVMAEMIARQGFTEFADDSAKVKSTVSDAVAGALLSGPVPVAQPIKVAVELATNHSFFTGRDIVGRGLESQEAFRQFSAGTSELAKGIGVSAKNLVELTGLKSEGLSPTKIDHVIQGMLGMYGGALVLATNSMVNGRPTQSMQDTIASLPGMGRIGVKEFDSQIKSDFYDLSQRVHKAVDTLNGYKRDNMREEYQAYKAEKQDLIRLGSSVQQIERQLSTIRASIRVAAANNRLTPEQRDARVLALRQTEQRMMKNLAPKIKQMRESALS